MRLCLPCVSTAANWSTPEYHDEFCKGCWITVYRGADCGAWFAEDDLSDTGRQPVHLKITMADRSSADVHELLWIFLDETQ